MLSSLAAAPVVDEGPGIHPNVVQEIVLADARKAAKADALAYGAYQKGQRDFPFVPAAPYQRYFRLTTGKSNRTSFLVVFCAHLNKLSTRKRFRWPVFVAPDVLRIDVRDYGWDERGPKADNVLLAWERTAKFDPTFHQQAVAKAVTRVPVAWPGGFDAKEHRHYGRMIFQQWLRKGETIPRPAAWLDQADADELRGLLYTESPILDAEWFFGQTCRQRSIYGEDEPTIGYYDFLALTGRDALFDLAGTDVKKARKLFAVWKAAVLRSKVALHNRQVFRLGAIGRFVWGTLDTFTPKDRGVLQDNLREGEFAHDAEEYMACLPNGLDFNFLCTDKGARQSTAPDKAIGSDRSKLLLESDRRYEHNDTAVHANVSCQRCHAADDLLKDVKDWARATFRKGSPLQLSDPDKKVTLELEDEYLTNLDRELRRDRLVYAEAVKEVTTNRANPDGWTVQELAKAYSEAFDRYAYEPITPTSAARELGVPRAKLMDGIKAYVKQRGQGDNVLSTWLADENEGIRRTTWEQRYPLAMSLAMGLAPPEEIKKGPKKP